MPLQLMLLGWTTKNEASQLPSRASSRDIHVSDGQSRHYDLFIFYLHYQLANGRDAKVT